MKFEELPSGSYRAKKVYKGKMYRITFDHKPTEKEVTIAFAEKMQDELIGQNGSFEKCAIEYMNNRDKVSSPATLRTYETKLNQLSNDFRKKNIYDITNSIVQTEVNLLGSKYEPKTVKTTYGFIKTILRSKRPSVNFSIKIPQEIQKDEYAPDDDDVRRILELAKNTRYNVPFQLAVMGMRRGEICALDLNDLKGNELWIHRDLVYKDGKWILKETPKTNASNRKLTLPDKLVKEIHEQGYIYEGHPNALNKAVHRFQKQLGIPEFTFHDLRIYFCSYAHELGISEANIMSIGGWATPSVMKKVYRKAFEKSKQESMKKITDNLFK